MLVTFTKHNVTVGSVVSVPLIKISTRSLKFTGRFVNLFSEKSTIYRSMVPFYGFLLSNETNLVPRAFPCELGGAGLGTRFSEQHFLISGYLLL